MTKGMNTFFVVLIVILISACTSQPNVFVDFNKNHDFDELKTFSWTSSNPMITQSDYSVSPFIGQKIMDEIKLALQSKGYVFVESVSDADFAVAFTVGARDKIMVRAEPAVIYRRDWSWGRQYWAPDIIHSERTVPYVDGTLAIDIYDVKTQTPIWHGVGSKKLSTKEKRGETENISAAVNTIISSFPIQM